MKDVVLNHVNELIKQTKWLVNKGMLDNIYGEQHICINELRIEAGLKFVNGYVR